MRTRINSGKAASVLAAFFLFAPGTAPALGAEGRPAQCHVEPRVLDVSRPAGPLILRIEMGDRGARAPGLETIVTGVHISSVAGQPLPGPGDGGEGIDERPGTRTAEDRWDAGGRVPVPNGVPELVVRFDRPCDGDPTTRTDGDAGDVLAMLMDVPDGTAVPICFAGGTPEGGFTCCDTVTVRNRGLRDLPRGLLPGERPEE